MDDIILFHGSRGSIVGNIEPSSRIRCDFGKGFYMGSEIKQAKSLVFNDSDPYIYTLKLKLSEIPNDRILNLKDDTQWLYTILANRDKVKEFSNLNIAKQIKEECKKYDVIIGPIADDRMNEALSRFTQLGLTDKGLIACLKYVDFGTQYVAKTKFACEKIEILDEKELYGQDLKATMDYAFKQKQKAFDIVSKIIPQYRNVGLYLDEIIAKETEKQLKQKDNTIINEIEEEEEYEL